MPNILKLAVVGCGGIASPMAYLARLTPGVEFVAACDIDQARVQTFSAKHKIPKSFTDYQEMLDIGGFDGVYLAVPHHLHFEMMKSAINSGLHIFTEKPITRTYAEGKDIIAYAAGRNLKIGVNYQYRYDNGCYRIARAVQAGSLGQVLYARINVPWHREYTYFDASPWHKTLAHAGGGTLITQASHLIDIVLWAVGSYPVSATGSTAKKLFTNVEVEDLAFGTIELENGALVQIASSMIAATEQPVTIEIYASNGTAIYSNQPWPRAKFIGVKPKLERLPVWGFHALHRSLKGYRDWIQNDRPYLIPGDAALPALQAVEAIYRSAATGQRVIIE